MLFLIVYVFFLIEVMSSCNVGVPRESSTLSVFRFGSNSGTQVYLGLENSASCGGYLRNYTICYYNRRIGMPVTSGQLSMWETGTTSNGLRVYNKISGSELPLPLSVNDTCDIEPEITPISNAPNPYPVLEIVCMYYCLPDTSPEILVKPGSVVGIYYSDGLKYNQGQMLTYHSLHTEGTCVASDFRFQLGNLIEVSCPLTPVNITTGLLAGAGIDPIYCPTLSVQYGNINVSGPYTYGTVIGYTCQTGFQLVGVSSQTCLSSGDWSDDVPYCIVLNCTDPGVPNNGGRLGSDFTNGSVVSFTCNNGYTLQGTGSVMCYRGSWTAPVPQCIDVSSSTSSSTSSSSSSLQYLVPSTSQSSIIITKTASSSPSPSSSTDTSSSQAFAYQFLTAILITIVVIIVIVLASALLFLYVYRKCFRTKNYQTGPLTYSQLDRPLLENDDLGLISEDIYDKVKSQDEGPTLPSRAAIHSTPVSINSRHSYPSRGDSYGRAGVGTPVTYRQSGGSYFKGGGGERGSYGSNPPPSLRSLPTLPREQLSPSSTHSFPIGMGFGGHYEVQQVEEEEDDDNESPYWVPSELEEELYLQLDRIRVKRIPSSELNVMEILGKGQFACVNRGIWTKPDGEELEVAVKVLSEEADEGDRIKFLQEAALMGQFTHTNVLTLHGVVTNEGNKTMIVTELMKGGDLRHWLIKRKRENNAPATVLLNFCRQICLGMSYLSSRKFVHRDLAARNILVTEDNICKVSDFGMSRDLTETDYYTASEGGLIPVKWTAPEALKYRKYSSASDVWSYGCVMYEIWSLGHKPFDTLKNNETLKTIQSGHRLSPTPGCPRMMYEIMMKCWHPESKKRPSFNEIMLLLLKEDQTLLLIPEDDLLTHSQAGQLGAGLDAGEKLYTDLQSLYVK